MHKVTSYYKYKCACLPTVVNYETKYFSREEAEADIDVGAWCVVRGAMSASN